MNKPSGTIVQTAVAAAGGDNGLDSLVVAVTTAGLATTLSSNTLTVFAPTNKAFRDLLLTALSLPNIKSIPLATLTAVLTYHVVQRGRKFSSDLGPRFRWQCLPAVTTTISLNNGGATIKGNGNGSNASANHYRYQYHVP